MAKIYTLKENHIFLRAYAKGKSSVQKTVIVYAFPASRLKQREKTPRTITSMGITAGKKIGGAVSRNRAKRLIREAYRSVTAREKFLAPQIIVIVARGRITAPDVKCAAVADDISKAFAVLRITEK